VIISEPFEGMPAALAGLKAGDRIFMIDTADVRKATTERVSELLKGTPNSKVVIKIERPGEKKPRKVEVTRKQVSLKQVVHYGVYGDGTGYIYLEGFKERSADEVREADLLLHVVDLSHPDFEEQIQVVERTLADLGCNEKPSMIVFNKIDNYRWTEKDEDDLTPETRENITLEDLKKTWMARLDESCMFISAKEKLNVEAFRETLYKKVRELHVQKYPYNDFLYPEVE